MAENLPKSRSGNTMGGSDGGDQNVQRDCVMTKEIAEDPQSHLLHVKPQYFRQKEKGE